MDDKTLTNRFGSLENGLQELIDEGLTTKKEILELLKEGLDNK